MKKYFSLTSSILAASFILSGCSGNTGPVNTPAVIDTGIPTDDYAYGFDYDEDHRLYYLTLRDTGEVEVFPASKEGEEDIVNRIDEAVLHIADTDGQELESYAFFDQRYLGQTLECGSGCIYFTLTDYIDTAETAMLKKYTIGDTSSELLHCFDELDSIKKTALINDTVYILGIDPENKGKNEISDDYVNSGEKILAYDLTDGNVSTVLESGAVEMSETSRETLMIYAHDNEGYFFSEYSSIDGFSEKQYYDLGHLYSFAAVGENRFVYSNLESNGSIASFTETGKADMMFKDILWGNVKSSDDGRISYIKNCFDESSGDFASILETADISQFLSMDLTSKLTMVSAEYIADSPATLGFSMTQEQEDYDSFALTVLSQDPKYDMYLLYSRSGFAENIKSKGSFYPLNEVEGVEGYINSCFAGLSEAAINEEGDIWMLPVSISVPALAYSNKLSEDISSLTTEGLISLINEMYGDKERTDSLGDFNAYFLSELILSNYLFESTDLDTEKFRSIAKMLKENVFSSKAFSETSKGITEARGTGDYSGIDLMMSYHGFENELISNSGLKAAIFPMPTEKSVPSTCAFICVNPMSKNLEQTLSYISALAKYLSNDSESLMRENSPKFTQSEYYEDLKEVYKNADVRFSYSGEIILNDFYGYLEGKLTLDDFISEANRKLSAYLNE